MQFGTAIYAQKMMSKKLDMRYFIVVATEGKSPFAFYEIGDNIDNQADYKYIGTLNYTNENRREKVNEFWKNILKL